MTMAFPARPEGANHIDELSKPPMEREEVRARVQYLFPRTETNWSVGGDEPRAPGGLRRPYSASSSAHVPAHASPPASLITTASASPAAVRTGTR